MPMNIRADYRIFTDRIDFIFFDKCGKKHASGKPLVFEVCEEGDLIDPTFSLKKSEAQELIDELWRCGIRPSEGTGSAGSLAATERHLKDMQKIALGLLKKDGIEL